MSFAVAVTGEPNSVNDPVAGGSVSVAETFPVLAFTFADSVPGPSVSVAFGPARNVLPPILYLALMIDAADAGPPAVTSGPAAISPADPSAAARLGHADRIAMDIGIPSKGLNVGVSVPAAGRPKPMGWLARRAFPE